MKFQSLKFGIISGALCGTMMTTAFYLGIETRNNSNLVLPLLLFVYGGSMFTIKNAKKVNGGEIRFFKAFLTGIVSGILTAIVFATFTYVYYTFLNPNYAEKYLVDIEISLKHVGKTGAALKKDMDEWREELSVHSKVSQIFINMLVFTAILSLINAIIFCKKD